MTTAKSVEIKLYFDAATNLRLRDKIPRGDTITTIEFGDFGDFGRADNIL